METVVQQMEEIHIDDQEQPEALQVIVPSRLPHYPPYYGPHHYRSLHPVELVTPGISLEFMKAGQSEGQSTRSDGTIKIPGYRAPMFPPMPIPEVFRYISLTDPKDLHIISRLEQEKGQVKTNVVLGTGPEGSLPRVIIRHNTQIFLAPDRLLPPMSPPSFDKGKEEAIFKHPSPPQPFPKHNLLDTTCIWAHELSKKNRAILAAIPVAKRSEWHAFRYLKDHHYQMLKASSGSGLTTEEKAATPTHQGHYLEYPIDRIHHAFHDGWKIIPARPTHQWHIWFLSRKFEKDLHIPWAYKLGWDIHFLKIPYTSLTCYIPPFTWLSDMTVAIHPPYPYQNILFLTYPLPFPTISSI